ncbi:SDR family oxidoreductase [Saccharopolyspora sp. K220]|uniref:SDR family NAD(P)-dependent oxidoreductase n=1 Tax=Saccharopolyspora soli TaxID=2926618 RepID=UPI001F5816B2|nr:SDR family oxidoreductase [Saccharopolyspora soli]MCI2417301.1 SDR family oxidoreductase [Saccharopolyspora soli]
MTNRLKARTAIVFGAGTSAVQVPQGCVSNGFATAVTFAAHGARVVAVDRDEAALAGTHQAIVEAGGECTAVLADVTDGSQVAVAIDRAVSTYGRLDIVHNNVGATMLGGPVELPTQDWNRAFDINVTSVFRTCKYAIPHLLERGGAIINVSSLASIRWIGYPYPAYAASKAAVNQLTQSLALQYADRGIRVNAILPGLIHTPLIYQQLAGQHGDAEAMRAERDASSPTGRMGSAWDVANAALFLASDEAAYINGVALPVDGGLHAKAG